jgi:hypothetical protein
VLVESKVDSSNLSGCVEIKRRRGTVKNEKMKAFKKSQINTFGVSNKNVRATVISQLRNGARALAKEWECSSNKERKASRKTSPQRPVKLSRAFCNRIYLMVSVDRGQPSVRKASDTAIMHTPCVKRMRAGRAHNFNKTTTI